MATAAKNDRRDDETSDDAQDEQEETERPSDDAKTAAADADAEAPRTRAKTSQRRRKKRAKRLAAEGELKGAARPARRQGAMAKSMLMSLIIGATLVLALWLLGREEGGAGGTPQPKWTKGQKADVEITLVYTDQQDLACASSDELAGKHCAFEAKGKPWSKGDTKDDKVVLRPYTTSDRIQFLAAGLWTDPGMTKAQLPRTRFTVKCKLLVDGSIRKPAVRWAADGPWYDQGGDWYTGSVSDCAITP